MLVTEPLVRGLGSFQIDSTIRFSPIRRRAEPSGFIKRHPSVALSPSPDTGEPIERLPRKGRATRT